jgi:hypothetical protein
MLHHAFGYQSLQGLAHRNLADPQVVGDPLQAQPLAGPEPAIEDGGPYPLGDDLMELSVLHNLVHTQIQGNLRRRLALIFDI